MQDKTLIKIFGIILILVIIASVIFVNLSYKEGYNEGQGELQWSTLQDIQNKGYTDIYTASNNNLYQIRLVAQKPINLKTK